MIASSEPIKVTNPTLSPVQEEQDRLNLQHQIMCLTLNGKLHCAPLSTLPSGIHNVLDLATGTGTWAIDFAQEYPSANVLGTDLSPIQPSFVPPNCRFEVDDAEDEWTFGEKFEYIHGRMLASCFASHRDVFRSCVEALRPGGWLEMQDVGFPFRCVDGSWEGTTFQRWNNLWVEAVSKIGKDFDKARFYKQYMEDVGLVDVTEMRLAWPVGSWAKGSRMKMIGVLAKQDVLQGLDAWSMALFTRGLGMPVEEIKALLKEVEDDLNTKRLHVYVPIYVVHGRKPEQ
jgi:SAM-dependent methyltransferase